MNWLVSTSLKLRVVVLALCAVLLVLGFRSLKTAPLDVFPEFAPPKVEVQTEAPAFPPRKSKAWLRCPWRTPSMALRA